MTREPVINPGKILFFDIYNTKFLMLITVVCIIQKHKGIYVCVCDSKEASLEILLEMLVVHETKSIKIRHAVRNYVTEVSQIAILHKTAIKGCVVLFFWQFCRRNCQDSPS